MDDRHVKQIVTGSLVVVVGLAMAGQQMFAWPGLEFGHLWPIIVIGMAVNNIVRGWGRDRGDVGWGVSLLLTGGVLLLVTERVLPLPRWWPLFVVAHGVGMLLNAVGFGRRRTEVHDGQ